MTQTSSPLFTIVMPAYRARATIAVAVASVLAQTETDFELLIVDDGSPDDTAAVALRAANGDPRVGVIRQENAGPAEARNRGIAAGSGELVAFLDADDRWAPEYLARHRDCFAARPMLGVSFARVRFLDPTLTVPGRTSQHVAQLTLARALGENLVCTTSNLVTRRLVIDRVGGFDTAMTHAEDQEWIVRVLASTTWEAGGIDAPLIDYRMSAQGLSADLGRMEAGWRTMIERARARAPLAVEAAEPAARALFERYLARRALRTGQSARQALRHLHAALRHHPFALLTHEPKRTLMTLAGAIGAALLPAAFVRAAIAR